MELSSAPRRHAIQLTEAVLGQPYFNDQLLEASLHRDPTQFEGEAHRARHLAHVATLRSIATMRHAARLADPDFDSTRWQPSPNDMEQLQDQLRPAIARIAMLNNFDTWMAKTNQAREAGLWPLQQVVMHETRETLNTVPEEARDQNSTFGIGTRFELATGFGKTVLALKTAQAVGIGQTIGGTVPVQPKMLYVTSRRHLVRQFKHDAAKYAPEIPVTQLLPNIAQPPDGITTTTYPGLLRQLSRGSTFLDAYRGGIICLDEAHNCLGNLFQEQIKNLNRDTLLLAYTATPTYADKRSIATLFPHRTSEYDIPTCIENGVIRGVQLLAIATGQELVVDTKNLEASTLTLRGFKSKDLASLADNDERNMQIVDLVQAFIESGRPTYVSCIAGKRCQHSNTLHEMLDQRIITDPITGKQRQLRSAVVNSYLPYDEVEKRKAAFEAGDIDALLDTALLGEGYHTDGLLAMVLTAPTTSPLLHIQRFGRGLHLGKHDKLTVNHTVVAELFDTLTYILHDSGEVLARQTFPHYFTSWDIFGDSEFQNGVIYEKSEKTEGKLSQPKSRDASQIVEGVRFPQHILRSIRQANAELLNTAVFVQTSFRKFGPPPANLVPLSELIKAAGRQADMDTAFARRLIKREFGIDCMLYDLQKGPAFCAPNTETIITALKETSLLSQPPDTWKTRTGMAKAFKLPRGRVTQAIKELEATMQWIVSGARSGRENRFYSPADQERIRARAQSPFENVASGDHTAQTIADECGTTASAVKGFFISRGHIGMEKRGLNGRTIATYSEEQRAVYHRFCGKDLPPGAAYTTNVASALGLSRQTIENSLKREQLGIYVQHAKRKPYIEAEMLAPIIGILRPNLAGIISIDTYAEQHGVEPDVVASILSKRDWSTDHTLTVGEVTLLKPAVLPMLDEAISKESRRAASRAQSPPQEAARTAIRIQHTPQSFSAVDELKTIPPTSGSKVVHIENALEKLGWSLESLKVLMRVARIPRQALAQDPTSKALVMHSEFMDRLVSHAARLSYASAEYHTLGDAAQRLQFDSSEKLINYIVTNSLEHDMLQVFRKRDSEQRTSLPTVDIYLSNQSILRIAHARQNNNS